MVAETTGPISEENQKKKEQEPPHPRGEKGLETSKPAEGGKTRPPKQGEGEFVAPGHQQKGGSALFYAKKKGAPRLGGGAGDTARNKPVKSAAASPNVKNKKWPGLRKKTGQSRLVHRGQKKSAAPA